MTTQNQTPATTEEAPIHPFERCGLGKAPFKLVSVGYAPVDPTWVTPEGITVTIITHGVTGCRYCGQAIREVFTVRSADGKLSQVGSSCIRKAFDKKLTDAVAKAEKDIAKVKREAAKAKRVAKAPETHAAVLARVEQLGNLGGAFARQFAKSLRSQILQAGKAPSPKQLALLDKLFAEEGEG